MHTALETDSAVWLPGDAAGTHDVHRVLDGASDLQLTVTVPSGAGEPAVEREDDAGLLRVHVHATAPTTIGVVVPTRDAVAIWRPGSHRDHARVAANWEGAEKVSALHDVALGALLGAADKALATFGASAGEAPLKLQFGVSEETAELMLFVTVEGRPAAPVPITVWIDRSGDDFSASVQAMSKRMTEGSSSSVSAADERPVFSTWYVMHQQLAQDDVLRQAEVAAQIGFGTVIIDDGWQSADTQRGYGSTGDWLMEPTKFPDAAALVSALAERGLRTMWWVGTPFIGDRSSAVDRFPTVAREEQIEASVFDPRSPAARAHLTDRVVRLMTETGAHGVKFDFVERFAQVQNHGDGVEAAAVSLLRDVRARIEEVSPGASIEFREPYIGPVATRMATMIRVNDCPMSPVRNRVGIVDLRLATRGIAVHADPIMWADRDSPERVAVHLVNALFAVPQVSVDLLTLDRAHREVVDFWIGFHNTHRRTLLHGDFVASRPDLSYPLITARSGDTVITARYQPVGVALPAGEWTRWFIANTEPDPIDLRTANRPIGPVRIAVRDARGRLVADLSVDHAPAQLQIPVGGLAEIQRT